MKASCSYTVGGHEVDRDAAWDYIRHGYLLAPRTVLKGRVKTTRPLPFVDVDSDRFSTFLQQHLVESMGKLTDARRAVMFSGGFDCMLLALLAKSGGAEVKAVTVQFDGFNPLTVAEATHFAKKIGIAHHIIPVKAVEFLSAFEKISGMTEEPLLDLDLAIVHAALNKYDPKIAGNVFISGMGCDQWFGDVAFKADPSALPARLDWAMVNTDAHHHLAQAHGCRFVFPFLSPPVLSLAQSIPHAMKEDKKLMRSLPAAAMVPPKKSSCEVQVPSWIRRILIKSYGHRAWPSPVAAEGKDNHETDQKLRQIVLGLWLANQEEIVR